MTQHISINPVHVDQITKALQGETPRGTIILVVAWIDHMMKEKFLREFSHGKEKIRDSLYSDGGTFSSLSSKLKVAYAAGWIDDDLFYDLNLLRKLRNDYAHLITPLSMDDDPIRQKLEQLKTPHRVYTDWGQLRAAETVNGILVYVGDKPEEAGKDLRIPGMLSLKAGVPAVVGALGEALGIEIGTKEGQQGVRG